MATQEQVIRRVWRRTGDLDPENRLGTDYYIDAIDTALEKLSSDFGASYLTVPDVPTNRVFLLAKLAAIEVCYMKASKEVEDVSNDEDDVGGGSISSLTVPDLSISSPEDENASGPAYWMKLASMLQDEYDEELSRLGGSYVSTEVTVGYLKRQSLTNGGYRKRCLDEGVDAVTVSTSVDGSDVTISWNILYSEFLSSYDVYRGVVSDMSDEERIAVIGDNQDNEYTDESLGSGTYYYRVKTVNYNDIETNSGIVTAVVS